MKLRTLALSLAALALSAFTSFAQVTTIEGDVKGPDGKPLQNAVILIHRTDIKWDSKTKTDKKGHYIHTGVPLGSYEISLEVEGKLVDKVGGVKTSMGGQKPVDFDMRQTGAAANASRQAEIQKAFETGQMSEDLKRQLSPEQKAALEKQMAQQAEKMAKQNKLNESFNVGITALQAKQYDQAIPALEKAGEVDPTQPAVFANLGDAYIAFAATKTGPEFDQNVQKGIDAYQKAIALKPEDANVHNNYALALSKAKKFPEMTAELKKAAELDPANAHVRYFNLGATLRNSGDMEGAATAFKLAIDAAPDNPTNAEAYYWYGASMVGQASISPDGKLVVPPGTVEAFQKYLQLAPAGKNAAAAKDNLAQLGSTIETNFKNPTAPPKKKK